MPITIVNTSNKMRFRSSNLAVKTSGIFVALERAVYCVICLFFLFLFFFLPSTVPFDNNAITTDRQQ